MSSSVTHLPADIFGGTFDPVQVGHLEVIRNAQLPDRVLVVAPTTQNPWKSRPATGIEHRMEMLRLALRAENLRFVEENPAPGNIFLCSYPYERSVEFLRYWRERHGSDLRWLVGPGDAEGAKTWLRWAEEGCPVIEMTSSYPFHSTDIRAGTTHAHPAIASYIEQHGLYR